MSDPVNHPTHYTSGSIECLDAIEAMCFNPSHFADYLRASVLKYLWRAPHKGNALQDLKKAQFYLNKLVGKFESGEMAHNTEAPLPTTAPHEPRIAKRKPKAKPAPKPKVKRK